MNSWPIKPLAHVCEINPRLPRNHNLTDDQHVSFVPMAAVDEVSGTISSEQFRPLREVKKGYTSFQNGDVLFAKITPCMENGKAAIANNLKNGHGFGSTEFHVLRPGPDVMAEWVFYFVRQRSFRHLAKQNFTGTAGQQRVPTTFLSSTSIPVPPLVEQKRFVDLLNRAEGIIQLRREAQMKAADLVPALFIDMFGDPITNPKRWPSRPLREVVSFISGGTPSKSRAELWKGDLPWVSPKDMKRMAITDATDHVNRTVLTETNIKLVPIGSLLIVVRGMILIHTVPVARSLASLTINQDMKALVPQPGINSAYLLWLMKVSQPQLLSMVTTAAHGTRKLETERIEKFLVPLPPFEVQTLFSELVTQIESIQDQQSAAAEKAKAGLVALLSRVFSVDKGERWVA